MSRVIAKPGRPLKFQSVARLEAHIDSYFAQCGEQGLAPTVTGLALWLGTTRKSLCEYERREQFGNAIKRAKLRCEEYILQGALAGKIPPAVAIFLLKNFGWSDRHQLEHRVQTKIVRFPVRAKDVREWEALYSAQPGSSTGQSLPDQQDQSAD